MPEDARAEGHREIASDLEFENTQGIAAHLALGYEEANGWFVPGDHYATPNPAITGAVGAVRSSAPRLSANDRKVG